MFDPNSILGDPRHRQEQLLLEAAWRFQLVAPLLDPLRSASFSDCESQVPTEWDDWEAA